MWPILLYLLSFCCSFHYADAVIEYNVTSDLQKSMNPIILDGKSFYKITENSLYSIDVTKHFISPGGLFHSFECTFRLDPAQVDRETNFSLIHLYNVKNTFHLSINLILKDNLVKIELKKNNMKTVFKFHFNKTADFLDGKFHNLMYGIHSMHKQSIECWIDCVKLGYHNINHEHFTEKNSLHHVRNLTLTIGEILNDKNESIPIDISKMRFHGYTEMPQFALCEDIGKKLKPKDSEEIKFKHVHIYHHRNRSEYNYESDESDSEESSEFKNDVFPDYDEYNEKPSTISAAIGFILFCCIVSVTAYLIKKYY